jgi:hypothetical protein
MKNPREYKKPIGIAMGVLNVLYMVFALVIYQCCPVSPRRTYSYIGINEEVPPEEMKMVNAAVIPVRKVGRPMA